MKQNASDAQRAIILGRGVPVDGRPCRTEVAKVNRELSWEQTTHHREFNQITRFALFIQSYRRLHLGE